MGGMKSVGPHIVSCRAVPESDKFVDVEQQPRKVADEEDEDEAHEDGRQIVLETATPLVDVLKGWKMKRHFGEKGLAKEFGLDPQCTATLSHSRVATGAPCHAAADEWPFRKVM